MDMLWGSIVNVMAIVLGGSLGLFFRKRLKQDFLLKIEELIGYCVIILGIQMGVQLQNPLLGIICFVGGAIIGRSINLENRIYCFSRRLKKLLRQRNEGFCEGFVLASVLYCAGSMGVVGAIESGAAENHKLLMAKAIIDGTVTIGLAARFGVGAILSFIPVFLYQGLLSLFASRLEFLRDEEVLANIAGVGGIILLLMGLQMTKIRRIDTGNLLPGVVVVFIAQACLYFFI